MVKSTTTVVDAVSKSAWDTEDVKVMLNTRAYNRSWEKLWQLLEYVPQITDVIPANQNWDFITS